MMKHNTDEATITQRGSNGASGLLDMKAQAEPVANVSSALL
jgi:hypothetical protein